MEYHYNWTVTSNYHYDATLTQSLLNNYLDDLLDSSGSDTHFYSLSNMGNLSFWPANQDQQHDTSYHYEDEGDADPVPDPPLDSTYEFYENFTAATGINFADFRSSAAAAGLYKYGYIPNGLTLGDNTSASNITVGEGGSFDAVGSNATLTGIKFEGNGGSIGLGGVSSRSEEYVVSHTNMGDVMDSRWGYYGVGGQSLTNMSATEDFDTLWVNGGASATVNGVTVERKMRNLFIAGGSDYYYNSSSTLNGSGTVVSNVTVHGVLSSAYVGNGAVLNMLTVGNYRQWGADSHASAFLGEDVWSSTSHMSATNMVIASGGTASNIYLGFGGSVTVMGPEDRVSSTWNSSSQEWEVTTAYASGTGGVLTGLQMATSGGLMLDGGGIEMQKKLWSQPYSYEWKASSAYNSGFIAGAPQSSYVSFGSNTSGRDLNIGNGGELHIGKNASAVNISMGGLYASITVPYGSGDTSHVWIGDRGAKLVINGGYASNVTMDPVRQSFDYYSAAHDYFWLYSSSLEREYYSSHNSTYPSGSDWSSSVLNSAVNGGYRQYMSAMYYSSSAIYTNFGDDTAYGRQYVGGEVIVAGGQLEKITGFSYLQATADVDVTVSNNVSSWSAHQWTHGHVSSGSGAVSATMEVAGGAHVYNIKIEGGRVLMTGGGNVNARWHGRENKQSNYNLLEDLDLRTNELLGSDHAAVIEFVGGGSGGWSQNVSGTYVDYFYDAMDPGEIHSVTANSGLIVSANWNNQDFTYIGNGAVTINGLGTVVLKGDHSRYTSDSYYGKGPYLGSAFDTYYFGVVKGVYDEEDGTLFNSTVLDGDNGFDWKGFLMVGSGGKVQNIGSQAALKTGNNLSSTTWTPEYTRDACKVLTVVAGGSADHVTVKGAVSNYEHFESQYTESRAGLLVSSGGTATNVTVLDGGIAMAKGGTIDGVYVGNGGTVYLSGWAGAHQVAVDSHGSQLAGPQYLDTTVLNGVRLDSGGQLTNTLDWGFRTGGHAPSVIANAGGGVMNGVTANGVAYVSGLDYAGAITLTKDQQGLDLTVRGFNKITSRDDEGNPTAYTTVVASLNVSSGGIVKGATVGDEGAIYVSEGADVSGLTASGGRLIFANSSGWSDYFAGSANVNGITVKDGGILQVNSKFGLTATNMKIEQDAGLEFTLGDTASEDYTPTELNGTWTADWGNGSFYTDDGTMSGFGGQFGHEYRDLFYSSAYVSARLSMTVAKGGILTGADLRGYGSVCVTSGGKIFNTHIRGITANIGPSGYASGLTATTDPAKNAYQTNIYVYGSGAVADKTVLSGGFLAVENGATVNSVTMMAPEGYNGPKGNDADIGPAEMEITAGGRANNVVASAGVITMYDGSYKDPGTASPTLSNADVHSAATLIVKADGAVLDGKLNLGGTVNTTVERTEYVEIEVTDPDTGDVYTDWQPVKKNNAVANASTLTVNFDLTERNGAEGDIMIDKLSNLQGATLGTITVKADQNQGTYKLAGGAADFNKTITVFAAGTNLGALSAGGSAVSHDGLFYALKLNSSVLSLTVSASAPKPDKPTVKASTTALTNKNVTLTASFSTAIRTKRYSTDKKNWKAYSSAGVSVAANGTYYFQGLDENGTASDITAYKVTNIDKVAPTKPTVKASTTDPTNKSITLTATFSADSSKKLYTTDNKTWKTYSKALSVASNGTYYFKAIDAAGNGSVTAYKVTNIDKVAPAKPTVKASTTDPTNKSITLTATFSADSTKKQYSLDNGETWNSYGSGVTVKQNGTVCFRGLDKAGNVSAVTKYKVTNIDKVAPAKPTVKVSTTAATNKSVTLTATFSADTAKKQYSLDNKTWKSYSSAVTVKANGTYYFRGIDKAGNISKVLTQKVSNIYPLADFTNDTLAAADAKSALKLSSARKISGWVGLGDPKDFIKLEVQKKGRVSLDMNAVTAKAQKAGQIQFSVLNKSGKTVAVSKLDNDTLATKSKVAAGIYYLGVSCADVKKYNTSYTVTAGMLAS